MARNRYIDISGKHFGNTIVEAVWNNHCHYSR